MCLKSFVIVSIFFSHVAFASSCMNCTENSYKFPEILMRKRRYLFFPAGSTILCTLSVVKAFVFNSPRGHNLVMEVDFYYPLPDKIIHPKRKNPAPVVTTTQKPTVEYHDVGFEDPHDDIHNHLDYHDRVDTTRRKSDKTAFFLKSRYPISYKKYQNHRNYISSVPKRRNWRGQQHNGHRERRDLYKSIEKFIDDKNIGLDGRSCILRTICEAQHWLMPKGMSLFHDIFRILFSLPSEVSHKDIYKEAMSSEEDRCSELYERKCPISILSLVLHSEKVI